VVVQFVTAAEQLLASFRPELFMTQAVTRVVLLFGPSPNRPGEIYDISVHAEQHAVCVPGAAHRQCCILRPVMRRLAVCLTSDAATAQMYLRCCTALPEASSLPPLTSQKAQHRKASLSFLHNQSRRNMAT